MKPLSAEALLAELSAVDTERRRRASEPGLAQRVAAIKAYQQDRFRRSYADLLADPRYAAATRFFLQDLYGPADYSRRDAQFARVIPAMTRLFPHEVVHTVAQLTGLHVLSERLDTRMAELLGSDPLTDERYAALWRACGEPEQRQRQIDLTMAVGEALDQLTRKPLLRQTLRMMRGPAQLAGLSELQAFLEAGFDTFKAMRGARGFLDVVRMREEHFARALFAGPEVP